MPTMLTTAVIVTYRARTGTDGDGRAVVAPDALSTPISSEISQPSATRLAQLDRVEVRADLIASVPARSLAAQAIEPKAGDIITLGRVRTPVTGSPLEITRVMHMPGARTIELTLAEMDSAAIVADPEEGDA